MENIKPLIMSQVVSVEKSNNSLTVDIKDLKKGNNIGNYRAVNNFDENTCPSGGFSNC